LPPKVYIAVPFVTEVFSLNTGSLLKMVCISLLDPKLWEKIGSRLKNPKVIL